MCAMIAMAVYDTVENDRTKYTKQTLESLADTVDFDKHRIILIDNNSCKDTKSVLSDFIELTKNSIICICEENVGTANAINKALLHRSPNEICIKMDNDVVVHQSGWVEELEQVFIDKPEIGISGLKRDDVTGYFTENGKLLMCDDIMGTCTAFNPLLLDKIGYMKQFSNYGFDDVLMSARSLASGFKNCFLPHIKITHLDEGGTEYTEWKKKEAAIYLQEAAIVCDMYKTGKLNYYYDGGFEI